MFQTTAREPSVPHLMQVISEFGKSEKSKKGHVSTANIADSIVKHYFNGISKFSEWGKERHIKPSKDFDELDDQLGESVNYLYQHGLPRYLAGDAIADFKQLHPSEKKAGNCDDMVP